MLGFRESGLGFRVLPLGVYWGIIGTSKRLKVTYSATRLGSGLQGATPRGRVPDSHFTTN